MKTTSDPISTFQLSCPYDPGKILATATGKSYVAVMLANGQIGVCSTLSQPVSIDPLVLEKPDLKKLDNRMLIAAYTNAHLNYRHKDLQSGDIFDRINFAGKKNTVMIGHFAPLVEKFRTARIPLAIFDLEKEIPDLTPPEELNSKLSRADCVIMTSTTLINSSFVELAGQMAPDAEFCMLGPTTTLDMDFKKAYGITGLFGMVFSLYDFEVLEIISKGLGTQAFSKKGKKVSL